MSSTWTVWLVSWLKDWDTQQMGLLLQIPEFSWFPLDLISMSHGPSAPAVPFILPSSGSSVTLAWCTGPSLSHDLNLQTPSFSIPGAELLPALLDSNLLTCLLQREHVQAGSVEPTTKNTENIQAKSEIVSLGPKTCHLNHLWAPEAAYVSTDILKSPASSSGWSPPSPPLTLPFSLLISIYPESVSRPCSGPTSFSKPVLAIPPRDFSFP